MKHPADPIELQLWRFVRGDASLHAFEQWVYGESALERRLGTELHLELIALDFGDQDAVWSMRARLGSFLRSLPGPGCCCIRLWDLDVVDMGTFAPWTPAFEQDREWSHEDVMGTLAEVRRRGDPYWWLWAASCSACGQAWLVGSEERQNDVFCLRRLDENELRRIEEQGRWPDEFDRYEQLLAIGLGAGRSVRFANPLASSLRDTVADLARERPGIAVSELAKLLNLEDDLAHALARRAVDQDQVTISFDIGPSR